MSVQGVDDAVDELDAAVLRRQRSITIVERTTSDRPASSRAPMKTRKPGSRATRPEETSDS